MAIAWLLLAAFFLGLFILVHRAKVKAMRRYIERGGWDDPGD